MTAEYSYAIFRCKHLNTEERMCKCGHWFMCCMDCEGEMYQCVNCQKWSHLDKRCAKMRNRHQVKYGGLKE